MERYIIKQIHKLSISEITHLVEESKLNGFKFLGRLVEDYLNGENTFSKNVEALYAVYDLEQNIVAMGGLNKDPFSRDQHVGRLRRFYVSEKHRRQGIGKALVKRIIEDARNYYEYLVLKTDTEQASQFYEAIGFTKGDVFPNSTHYMKL